mmetsp:Transcript_45042/g.146331  ORF Transcript_45042/g.146331 Transcript_45042/m.146331 type:complete len:209 (-) Transcript_45042:15-641(-)
MHVSHSTIVEVYGHTEGCLGRRPMRTAYADDGSIALDSRALDQVLLGAEHIEVRPGVEDVEARRRGGGYVERHRRPHVLCQLAHSRLGHEAVRHVIDVQLHFAVRLDDRHRCPVHARRSSRGGRDEVLSQRRSLKTVYARDKTGYGRRQRQRPDDMKRDACSARGEPRRPPHQSRQPHNPTRETSRERESPGQVREVERIGSRQKGGE